MTQTVRTLQVGKVGELVPSTETYAQIVSLIVGGGA